MLRRLSVQRRVPAYVFSGDPLIIDYTLENAPALVCGAGTVHRRLVDSGRSHGLGICGDDAARLLLTGRWPGTGRGCRWQCKSPRRGKYQFRDLDPGHPGALWAGGASRHDRARPTRSLVYPEIGHLTRRWFQIQRQATENRRGQRHDHSAQQLEYHGLRDYRPGDSPRWIHWRTSARRGELMVKEFEQQNEQDLAILVDPWLPRTKAGSEQREALEQAISFAATVCLETCRHQGRRLVLGWTGAAPGVRHGPASVKLLHELLEQLAIMRPASEGGLAELFDVMPPAVLREALLVDHLHTAPQPDRGGGAILATLPAHRRAACSGGSSCSMPLPGDLDSLFQLARRLRAESSAAASEQCDPGATIESGATAPRVLCGRTGRGTLPVSS